MSVQASGAISEEYSYLVYYQERILYYDYSDFEELILERGVRVDGDNTYPCFIVRTLDTDYVIIYDDTKDDGVLSFPAEWNYTNVKIYTSDGIFCVYDNASNCLFVPTTYNIVDVDINLDDFDQMVLNPSSLESLGTTVSSYSISNSFYFSNLKDNMGINDNGSCTYVALTSVLGYYDIFLNDNIIINNYEDKVFMLEGTTNNSYNAIDCNNSPGVSDEFHDFIIQEIGINEKDFHNFYDEYGLNRAQAVEVMESYLENYTSFNYDNYTITLLNSENAIIQKLNNDVPVILGYNSWGYDVEIMSENYLFNLFNYRHMVIAYGYEILDDGTVYFRCNLGWQGVDRTSDIFVKSYNSIEGFCLEFNEINHICSSLYVNEVYSGEHQSFCPCCGNLIDYEHDIHCRSDNYEGNINLPSGKKMLMKINVECPIQYEITASADNKVLMKIYNEDMSVRENGTPLELNNGKHIVYSYPLLAKGTYYIEIYFDSNTSSGIINYEINPYTSTIDYISSDDEVDVLTHLHENKNEFVISPSEPGLFLLELTAKVNNEYVNPHAEFVVKDIYGDVVQKVNISGHDHLAYSVDDSNNIMFYANRWCGYTVYLEVDDLEYQELTLTVNKIEDFIEFDIPNNDEYYSDNSMFIGDFAYIYNLERIGTYDINIDYCGNQTSNMLFVIYEKNGDGNYVYKNAYEINSTNDSIYFQDIVGNSKKLLLCVFDSEGLGRLQINIEKYNSSSFTIITDPSVSTAGSEVKLNGGALGATTITKGFTRICYLGNDAPDSKSRYLYYNWYSTNTNVATVSSYGTIMAVGVGTTTIQCVYKANPSIIATLQITVTDYTGTEDINLNYGMDVRTGGTISGTEVTSGFGFAIEVSESPEVTMHVNKTRLICLGNDSPSSNIQDFTWVSNAPTIASVSAYGTITANRSGAVTIIGTYKYNPNYIVEIYIEVL